MGSTVCINLIRTCKPRSRSGYCNKRTDLINHLSSCYDNSYSVSTDIFCSITKTQSSNSSNLVTILSILSVVHRNEWMAMDWLEALPLFNVSFEWIPFMIVGYIVGYVFALNKPKLEYFKTKIRELAKSLAPRIFYQSLF